MSFKHKILSEYSNISKEEYIFYKNDDKHIVRIPYKQQSITNIVFKPTFTFLKEVLLPSGYPDSVSADYLDYQKWDTMQAFCSTIIGIFTTKAILSGVGVGNAEATALSATITWILKDGSGMIGQIIFTWWKGNILDCDCKKWRLFADIINDIAMLIELSVPLIKNNVMMILCISTTMKSLVGVAGGATRVSITNHQAIKGNTAEIAAKDGTQETLVNLTASFLGIFLLSYITNTAAQWCFIIFLIYLHLFSNYKAVKSLVFTNVNVARFNLILLSYLSLNAIPPPKKINPTEPVILGTGVPAKNICGFDIIFGKSLKKFVKLQQADEFQSIVDLYNDKQYIIFVDYLGNKLYVNLGNEAKPQDVIESYFHANLLGLAITLKNNHNPLTEQYSKKQLHHSNPMTRLTTFLKTIPPSKTQNSYLSNLNEFIYHEVQMFLTAFTMSGWSINQHFINTGEWRVEWKNLNKKD